MKLHYVAFILIIVAIILTAFVVFSYNEGSIIAGGAEFIKSSTLERAMVLDAESGEIGDIPLYDDIEFDPSNTKNVSVKQWNQFPSWDALKRHPDALKKYIYDRDNFLNREDLDWSRVIKLVEPKIDENYEYIGLVNADDNALFVSDLYKSDVGAGTIESETVFASIPADLVTKVGKVPALFMFHTHPSNPIGSPLPSSQDLVTAIYYATEGHYAASMVYSRYGILLYGINDEMKEYFSNKSMSKKELELARLNYTHDVVAAHESIRSWSEHTLRDYVDFYARYRMFLYIYPSSEFIATRGYKLYNLLSPVDYEVIEDRIEDIKGFTHKNKNILK